MTRNNDSNNRLRAWIAIILTATAGFAAAIGAFYQAQAEMSYEISIMREHAGAHEASYDAHVQNQHETNLKLQEDVKDLSKAMRVVSDNVIRIGARLNIQRMHDYEVLDD